MTSYQLKMKFKLTPLKIGLIAAGIIGVGYLLKTFPRKKPKVKQIAEMEGFSLELTRRISNELRYGFLVLSIGNAQKNILQRINQLPFNQREPTLQKAKEAMLTNIQNQEEKVLSKFYKTNDQYIKALKFYGDDEALKQNEEQIKKIIKASLAFEYPDLSVSTEAKAVHNMTQILQIFRESNFHLSILLWREIKEEKRIDPEFNHNSLENMVKVSRKVDIYHQKNQYLATKGYHYSRGEPSYIFTKIYESYKKEDPDFKSKATVIEQGYDPFFVFLMNHFELSEEELEAKHNDFIRQAEQNQPQRPLVNRAPQILTGSTEGSQPVSHQHQQQQRTLQQFWESRVNQFRQSDYSSGRDTG